MNAKREKPLILIIDDIPQNISTIDSLLISARMRFRAFKPSLLAEELLVRQPVFDMARIETTFTIP